MLSRPDILLRAEGAFVGGLALIVYRATGAHWGTFLLVVLWPDLFMLGYVVSVRLGASLYNLVHSYVLPLGLAGVCIAGHRFSLAPFACIWLAHIGFDRAMGFGLKYPTFFRDTHLQHAGVPNPMPALEVPK